jgi:hypothetical protein
VPVVLPEVPVRLMEQLAPALRVAPSTSSMNVLEASKERLAQSLTVPSCSLAGPRAAAAVLHR